MAKRGNGEGTMRQVRPGRWEGRITVGKDPASGKLVRRKVTARTQGELVARMREALAASDAGITPARRDLSVGAFLDRWLDEVLPGTVSIVTEAQYRQVARLYVIPRIGRRKLRTLSAADVSKMLRDMAAAGYSVTAQRLARSVLRRAIRFAEQEGLVTRNVAAIAPGPRKEQTEGRTMTEDEVRRFLTAVKGHRLEAAFIVCLALGLRVSELGGLAWNDVKLSPKSGPSTIAIRRGLKRVKGYGLVCEDLKTVRSRRTLHLPQPAIDALSAHRKAQAAERLRLGNRWPDKPLGHDLVFRTIRGLPLDGATFWRALNEVTESAELGRWHPHELRHSAASLLLHMGVPLKVVSETLGHSTIAITADIYGHLLDDARAKAADAMTRAMAGAAS